MRVDVFHHDGDAPPSVVRLLHTLITKVSAVMTTQAELATAITDLKGTIDKIGTESAATLQKVSDLEAALANAGNVDPAVQEAFDALKASVQKVDDLVPDAPAPGAPTA